MPSFRFLVYTPAGHDDPGLAIAASRAGEIGVFNGEWCGDTATVLRALGQLANHARQPFGLKLGGWAAELPVGVLDFVDHGLRWLILEPALAERCGDVISPLQAAGGRVLVELCVWDPEFCNRFAAVDGWIVKGHESGGVVGEETSFILLQKMLAGQDKPVYVRGGIGLHSAGACCAAGAAGAVLDNQFLLLRESRLRERLQPVLAGLVGTETALLGDPGGGLYVRVLERPGYQAVKTVRQQVVQTTSSDVLQICAGLIGWDDPQQQLLPLGQDAAFAPLFARRYGSVAAALQALQDSAVSHLRLAAEQHVLGPDSALARSHGTRYPIVQGPMTRVSDTAGFAAAVADSGALPMLALALLRGNPVRALLADTTQRLAGKPWGVGLLGFAPADLLEEQVSVSREFHPAFAIIAGGRPDQALALEQVGIPSYLHVPSPRLLSLFIDQGARHFVFEGRECGGHIGPLCSFVLWDAMVQTLLDEVTDRRIAEQIHVLFAGGVHDRRSAAMVAALAAPLAAKGIKVGVLMGSAYLFTREIVATGSIVPAFQQEALACQVTVGLETGTGHASRCARTPFAEEFLALKQQLQQEGKNADEIRNALEDLNLGRLRLASKGQERAGRDGPLQEAPLERQQRDGMYMLGQVAALMEEVGTVAELHAAVSEGSGAWLAQRTAALTDEAPAHPAPRPADVAIIGIGCVLPKAGNVCEFWDNLLDQVDGITEIPPHRWDWRLYFDPDRTAPDKIYSKWGGFLDDLPFDPLRYGIPPKTIRSVDPLQLMTLEVVRQTLEDAGYATRNWNRERISLILGASGGAGDVGAQYAVRAETTRFQGELPAAVAERLPQWTEDTFAGILLNVAAGRAANRFDFGGVNFTVDAACASSLAAVYQAVVELQDSRSDMVIAGGVDTVQGPFGYLCFSKTQALSPRGRCNTFDTSADGIVISEGIAMVALKRLTDAERDGDHIYAVIKGVGGSSDGRARSMTAPHPDGQLRALRRAYEQAGYSPATVGLFEAHGTGTVAGDTAELETTTRLLREAGATPRQSAIGSVKTLIGHTKATAGVAGLIKATMALYQRVLPPHSHVQTPNPQLADPDSPLYLVREPIPWLPDTGRPRRASVSAFGFGGTNFHVTLEEYQGDYLSWLRPAIKQRWPVELLVWRAPDRAALTANLQALRSTLQAGAKLRLADLAFTLARRLPAVGDAAAALVVPADADLEPRLNALLAHLEEPAQPLPPGACCSPEPLAAAGKIAAVFPGQGCQYPQMLRQLAVCFPEFAETLSQADVILAERLAASVGPDARLSRLIYPPGLFSAEEEAAAAKTLTRTELAQPALGAVEAALWRLLQQFGLRLDLAAGHSYGEYVALHAAGVLPLDDLLRLSEARGRFIVEAAEGRDLGTMAAAAAAREKVLPFITAHPEVTVANYNAPRQTILSGPPAAIDAIVAALKEQGIQAQRLPVGAAFHSPLVAPAAGALGAYLEAVPLQKPRFPVYSNTTAAAHADDVAVLRATLAEHLGRTVEFVAEIEAMYTAGARLFLEVGPKNVMANLVDQILGDRSHRAVRIDDNQGGLKGLLNALGTLFAEGVALDFTPLYRNRAVCELDLGHLSPSTAEPAYPAHIWMLNGSGARPVNDPPAQPLTLERVEQTRQALRQFSAPAGPPPLPSGSAGPAVPLPQELSVVWEKVTMSDNPLSSPGPVTEPAEDTVLVGSERENVLLAYQETMRHFLQVQENIMLGYLNGAGGARRGALSRQAAGLAVRPSASRVLPFPRTATPPAVTVTMPPPKAPAPVPAQPAAPPPAPADYKPAESAAQAVVDAALITKTLLDIVEERTGYPRDMLALDQNMEAELGIDSIKRVEIVGTILKALPQDFVKTLGDAAGALNQQKTLQAMIDWLTARLPQGEAVARPFEPTGAREMVPLAGSAASLRFVMQAQLEEADRAALTALPTGGYVIVADEAGIATVLTARLEAAGAVPVLIPAAVVTDPAECGRILAGARQRFDRVQGLIYLAALTSVPLDAGAPASEWRRQSDRDSKGLYRLLQLLAEDLRAGGRVVAASGLGGYFGRSGAPPGLSLQGGAVGILKSLREEWPSVWVRAVDLDLSLPAAGNAEALLTELRLHGGRIEVGYPGGRRTIFRTVAESLAEVGANGSRQPRPDWVVLATGGARGITAEALAELAPTGLTLVLAGRTPEPAAEAADTAVLRTVPELRRWLIEQARRDHLAMTPAAIERRLSALLRDREILANLCDLRAAGARVDYRIADVRDEQQVEGLLEAIYREYGRLDGVVHGAGILDDRLLVDKTPASWDDVYNTKVESAAWLVKHLQPDTLRFLMFFASVAGRYGNSGQVDYAAANEVLNRLAWQLRTRWQDRPIKVVALNWGPWAATRHGSGMVSPETRRKFESKGVRPVEPEQGRRLFWEEITRGPLDQAEVIAGSGPWESHEAELGTMADVMLDVTAHSPLPQTGEGAGVRAAHRFPLLDGSAQARGPRGEIIFRRTLSVEHDHYLTQHTLDGIPVFPAAVALELMAEAAATVWSGWVVNEIRDLRVLRGIRLTGAPLDIEIVLLASSHGDATGFDAKMELRPVGGGLPFYLATARLGREAFAVEPYQAGPPPAASPLTIQDAYRDRLFHGPCFQTITRLTGLDAGSVVADLRPSDPREWLPGVTAAEGWLFDPGLVDSAPQLALVWAHARRQESALPNRFGSVRRFGTQALGPCRQYFLLYPRLGEHQVKADVAFVDWDGNLRLFIEELECTSSAALNRLGGGWKGAVIVQGPV